MTTHRPLAFAIPGDIDTLTGGYIYERHLLQGLRRIEHDVEHIPLPASFPNPDPDQMAETVARLAKVAPTRPLILDGLVFGAIETHGLAKVRAPIVAMIHHPLALESGLDPDRRAHLFRTEYDNLRLARHVIVPSPHTRRILMAQYDVAAEAITIARPGVDRPRLTHAPTTPPLILSVGILHPRKGHDILIDALAMLGDLDWRAVIAGNPWDQNYEIGLRQQIADSPVASRIQLAGRVSTDELEQLYSSASIFALATRYEGHGIALDEALIRGLPIISCDTGAVPDTVPNGAGILVPPHDPQSFAEALHQIISDDALRSRITTFAKKIGRQLPDWQHPAKVVSEIFEKTIR